MWEFWLFLVILLFIASLWKKHSLIFSFMIGSLFTLFFTFISHLLSLQLFCFAIVSTIVFFVLKYFSIAPLCPFKLSSHSLKQLIGKHGTVKKDIGTSYLESGAVSLDGETWPALSYNHSSIPAGSKIYVKNLKGLYVLVIAEQQIHP